MVWTELLYSTYVRGRYAGTCYGQLAVDRFLIVCNMRPGHSHAPAFMWEKTGSDRPWGTALSTSILNQSSKVLAQAGWPSLPFLGIFRRAPSQTCMLCSMLGWRHIIVKTSSLHRKSALSSAILGPRESTGVSSACTWTAMSACIICRGGCAPSQLKNLFVCVMSMLWQ